MEVRLLASMYVGVASVLVTVLAGVIVYDIFKSHKSK
nr:MAG TPA: hypothetical protein [Caudoviricetes sp.]